MRSFDIDTTMQRLAERRIEEAMRQGKFDNLPGRGRPCEIEPMPLDENARMIWWALRLTKNAGKTPDEIRLRRQLDSLRDELSQATSEARVRALVGSINAIAKHVNAIVSGDGGNRQVALADLGRELGKLHHRTRRPAGGPVALTGCRNDLCASVNPGGARFCRRCGAPIAQLA
jgi:hypothetical protein